MKEVYRVREFFVSSVLGPKFAGEFFPDYQLKFLTFEEKKKLDVTTFSLDYDVWNYGLIFYSTEEDFPEEIPDETRQEMFCRAIREMQPCCENGQYFLKHTNGETD